MVKKLSVLIACEESQTVCKAFRKKGHEAFSCDLLPPSGSRPEWHIQSDVVPVLYDRKWDLVIAHPPCTRLSKVGLTWLYNRNLYDEMRESVKFFNVFRDYGRAGNRICIENPVPHRHALKLIEDRYSQVVHPWQHGRPVTKPYCLWLYNLPRLVARLEVGGRENVHGQLPGNKDRQRIRSVFCPGIAQSMAEQWTQAGYFQQQIFY